ncbi:MAG: phosphoribosylamine--glycine ligase, partial [Actinomycetota bacterium]
GSVATPATEIDADLYVIGPEAPLVAGLADDLRAAGRSVFGPGSDGARLEGSKAWMKDVLVAAGVPTARHGTFTEVEPAFAFLDCKPRHRRRSHRREAESATSGLVRNPSRTHPARLNDYTLHKRLGAAQSVERCNP